jgi:hypothetical protein
MTEPTQRQKMAFKHLLEEIEKGKGVSFKEIMLKSGYSENTAINPKLNLTSKEGWKSLMSQIKDDVILARIYEILLGDDKRSSLTSADMLLKLKNKYPKGELKAIAMFTDLEE